MKLRVINLQIPTIAAGKETLQTISFTADVAYSIRDVLRSLLDCEVDLSLVQCGHAIAVRTDNWFDRDPIGFCPDRDKDPAQIVVCNPEVKP